jgi:hypothetical protein
MSSVAGWLSRQFLRLSKFFGRFEKKVEVLDKSLDEHYKEIFG